ncbi:MAG: hypothetical protein GX295_07825 [Syntrophomonadaceae bacterium]|nr:hypothetical protein [Syntrophomonadaceae bacterium]
MFWFNWVLNSLVFLLVFNFTPIINWYHTRTWEWRNPYFSLLLPLGLALVLTVVDSLRLYFVYQVLILVIAAGALYWLFGFLNRPRR